MNVVTDWIREVLILILSITFMEMMLPEGNLAKYLKFIFSLVILAVILEPLRSFVHKF